MRDGSRLSGGVIGGREGEGVGWPWDRRTGRMEGLEGRNRAGLGWARARLDHGRTKLKEGKISPGWRRVWWFLRGNRKERERRWREGGGFVKPSLIWAMNDSVAWWFWSSGLMKVTADTSQVLSPLLVKVRVLFLHNLVTILTCP